MKFSVLLPTRNRLEYLRSAVGSVLRQDYPHWELIISDNCSEQDVRGYVESVGDPRIKYFRTDRPVGVTENWNNALERCSGDYVVMLGDDDALLRGYFTAMARLIGDHTQPDFVYHAAYLYAYPGVLPGYADGHLRYHPYATFFDPSGRVTLIEGGAGKALAKQSLDFRMHFGCNMQYMCVRRSFIESLKDRGPFYQSPFPDFYAANVMFLRAERIVVCPLPAVVIGVTPKSYGYYHFNDREEEGKQFLGSEPDESSARRLGGVVLPGTNINTSWLFAMEAIAQNYGKQYRLHVNYTRYRVLQITHMYFKHLSRTIPGDKFRELKRRMWFWETLFVGGGINALRFLEKVCPILKHRLLARINKRIHRGQFPAAVRVLEEPVEAGYSNIDEVVERKDGLDHAMCVGEYDRDVSTDGPYGRQRTAANGAYSNRL